MLPCLSLALKQFRAGWRPAQPRSPPVRSTESADGERCFKIRLFLYYLDSLCTNICGLGGDPSVNGTADWACVSGSHEGFSCKQSGMALMLALANQTALNSGYLGRLNVTNQHTPNVALLHYSKDDLLNALALSRTASKINIEQTRVLIEPP